MTIFRVLALAFVLSACAGHPAPQPWAVGDEVVIVSIRHREERLARYHGRIVLRVPASRVPLDHWLVLMDDGSYVPVVPGVTHTPDATSDHPRELLEEWPWGREAFGQEMEP